MTLSQELINLENERIAALHEKLSRLCQVNQGQSTTELHKNTFILIKKEKLQSQQKISLKILIKDFL